MVRSALSEGPGRSGGRRSEPGFTRWDSRGGCPYVFRREPRQRYRHMLMHRLPLVVIFRMKLTIRPGDGLRGLVRFEAQIAYLMFLGLLPVAQAVVAKH